MPLVLNPQAEPMEALPRPRPCSSSLAQRHTAAWWVLWTDSLVNPASFFAYLKASTGAKIAPQSLYRCWGARNILHPHETCNALHTSIARPMHHHLLPPTLASGTIHLHHAFTPTHSMYQLFNSTG